MRISDWSSDVCSSDLNAVAGIFHLPKTDGCWGESQKHLPHRDMHPPRITPRYTAGITSGQRYRQHVDNSIIAADQDRKRHQPYQSRRSEEHTSELQSLMRISYAVFCLKKKKHKITHRTKT